MAFAHLGPLTLHNLDGVLPSRTYSYKAMKTFHKTIVLQVTQLKNWWGVNSQCVLPALIDLFFIGQARVELKKGLVAETNKSRRRGHLGILGFGHNILHWIIT